MSIPILSFLIRPGSGKQNPDVNKSWITQPGNEKQKWESTQNYSGTINQMGVKKLADQMEINNLADQMEIKNSTDQQKNLFNQEISHSVANWNSHLASNVKNVKLDLLG